VRHVSFAVLVVLVAACSCKRGPPVDAKTEAEGHYLAASSAYLKGDFKEAHAQYDEVRRLSPDDRRLPGAEGELLMAEQRIDEALARFEEAAKLDPKRATTWSRLGVLYAIKGQKQRSTEALHTAIELNPKDFNAHESLGDAALEKGDLDEAVKRYLLASDSAPGKAQAELVVKASAELLKAKKSSRALEVLEQARAKGISSPELNQELGDRYVDASKWDEAVAAYTAAAEKDHSAWELVAELELKQGRFEQAEAAWRRGIAVKDLAVYHVGLARLCLAKRDTPCAEKELEKALTTATGEEIRESLELAHLLSALGRKADGLKLLEAVAGEEEEKKNEALQLAFARAANELGKAELVKTACERIAPVKCP
jgi:tetratricopeptide (TPR) repeat protein